MELSVFALWSDYEAWRHLAGWASLYRLTGFLSCRHPIGGRPAGRPCSSSLHSAPICGYSPAPVRMWSMWHPGLAARVRPRSSFFVSTASWTQRWDLAVLERDPPQAGGNSRTYSLRSLCLAVVSRHKNPRSKSATAQPGTGWLATASPGFSQLAGGACGLWQGT